MAARDAQDILDVKQAEGGRPKKKAPKQKIVRPAHIPKEVWLLETQGDRAPPVSLTAPQPKKPKFTRKVKPWEWQAFTHPNRTDGLVLRHWRQRSINPVETQENGPATPAEGPTGEMEQDKPIKPEPPADSVWAKYNVKVDVAKYTDEEYTARLQSDEWTREETDYLMSLVEDFDLRWIVIGDRYDYRPALAEDGDENSMAIAPAVKQRTMEDMKSRYYKIAAAMMDMRMGLSNMTPAEFKLHEKMLEFDAEKEMRRKKMAEQLLKRSDEEIEEERRLLIELKRIIQEEDDFIRERTELFERLNAPPSKQSIAQFESSQGLVQLMQNLHQQDRTRSKNAAMSQRRAIAGMEDAKDKTNSPATPAAAGGRGPDSRKIPDSTASGDRRKDSKSSHAHTQSFVQRKLNKQEEEKYGVQRPEKLLAGEKIRHLRIEKRVTARAQSVAAKVQDSMVELGIPIKPIMATAEVVANYEELCANLDQLLDFKRHCERTENEIKILKAKLEMKDVKDGEGDGEEKQEAEGEKTAEARREGANADEDAETAEDARKEEAENDDDGDGNEDEEDNDDDQADDVDRDKSDDEDEAEDIETPVAGTAEDDANEENEVEGGDGEVDDDLESDAANGEESRPSTRASGRSGGRKRSVSVLSSTLSQKSTKRQRK